MTEADELFLKLVEIKKNNPVHWQSKSRQEIERAFHIAGQGKKREDLLLEVTHRIAKEEAAKMGGFIIGRLGMMFRRTIYVKVRKPRWMTERFYRWLMRTVIVEEHR